MALTTLVLIGLIFTNSAFSMQKRGVVEEVGNLFETLTHGFTSGVDQFHKAAREEVSRLQVKFHRPILTCKAFPRCFQRVNYFGCMDSTLKFERVHWHCVSACIDKENPRF